MELTSVLSDIHAQIMHVSHQLEGDLSAPAVLQIRANLETELARLAQQAEEIAAKVIDEIEARVAGRIAAFTPPLTIREIADSPPETGFQATTTGAPATSSSTVPGETAPAHGH